MKICQIVILICPVCVAIQSYIPFSMKGHGVINHRPTLSITTVIMAIKTLEQIRHQLLNINLLAKSLGYPHPLKTLKPFISVNVYQSLEIVKISVFRDLEFNLHAVNNLSMVKNPKRLYVKEVNFFLTMNL